MKISMYLTAGIAACAFGSLAIVSAASPAFAATLNGSWSGSGYVTPSSGKRESVRCRVSYSQRSSKVFGVSATCASSSQSIRQTGEVLMVRPNRYVGDFYNQQFDVGGRISITVRGSSQSVTFSGNGVKGHLSLSKR